MKKVKYLQGKNPCVPGIVFKLTPENDKQRKLKYVRELWNEIIDVSQLHDIYTNKPFERNQFDVDHFVPWSFVANDELWNLMPMDSSLNSSKNNKLPDWNKYFLLFADNQYLMYQNVLKYEKIRDAFNKCQRDNLLMPWSLEELYVPGCNKYSFISILEKNLKNVYDSAKMQGYEIWRN
jgi:CRISPR/Cas system Type II protein with McrA/HNH and RuvC-like nuclease domain